MNQHREGDLVGAVEIALMQQALNDRIARGQGDLMCNLVNNNIAASSHFLLISLLGEDGASIDQRSLERLDHLFPIVTPPDEAMDFAFGAEYEYKLRSIREILNGTISGEKLDAMGYITDKLPVRLGGTDDAVHAFFDVDLSELAARLDEERVWVTNMLSDQSVEPPQLFEDIYSEFPKVRSSNELSPGQLADYWTVVMTDGGSSLPIYADRAASSLARQRLIQTRVALELARRDGHGVGSLANLVPDYLPEVPLDPFSKKSLVYDQDGGRLFSVGKDLVAGGDDIDISFPAR